jgi:hypothetical protein
MGTRGPVYCNLEPSVKPDNNNEASVLIGPFIKKTISTLRISPIGLVPKKSGFHLITHLSYPDIDKCPFWHTVLFGPKPKSYQERCQLMSILLYKFQGQ